MPGSRWDSACLPYGGALVFKNYHDPMQCAKGAVYSVLMKANYYIVLTIFFSVLLGCTATVAEWDSIKDEVGNKEIIVLLHGLGRGNIAMWKLASRLEDAGYYVQRVGYSSLTQTPDQILEDVSEQINKCCVGQKQTVHFVGHSLGGLLIRAYLQDNKVSNLGRVVLMGTPNQGNEIVEKYRDSWWMQFAGPTALALGTEEGSFPNTLKDPYYPVGVIAGETDGDNDEYLPGKDDGLVSVESTKLKNGMTDFIIIETGHSMMRYNEDVAKQTISFLQSGRFNHRSKEKK